MKTFQILIFLFATLFVSAQNETNHWYFGNKAALEFNLGTSLTINSDSEMNTPAGSSSISDKEGNLLFYTNGETIWNKNHQIMENGEGLLGNKNHTQSSIIIPKPKSEEIFYVFTVRKVTTEDDSTTMSGVRFSEIEISAEFPLGKIINKNTFLRNTTSERITAIHHKDDTAIWVITNGINRSLAAMNHV